ncbi:YqiA/YcfP family alpha/beta fold hydrolase [Facilibium subflavum]|uniref:YqiA/YcfP family alpha/beta fold hydrolase n=1 Tax=Facilibium subflavum TaxID=2219058 RepID=UPI000E65CCCD|nr:YqiA/YcfP family alpha/beta fold hydrolase [Facilibium subflavum]
MSDYYFLYLHGYKGSPDSVKAQKLKRWLKKNWPNSAIDAPALQMHSESALQTINYLLNKANAAKKVIIGSSLGGYMAHLFKQIRSDIDQVVLINPAARLDLIVADPAYAELRHEAKALMDLMPAGSKDFQDYLLLLQADDTTTPITFAKEVYAGANIDIKTGQGHGYDNIEVSFDVIEGFLCNKDEKVVSNSSPGE